jgi:uncharacterized protein YbjT (DUF2867 family)
LLYSAAFHLLLGRVYDDKDVQERIVRRSKLDWVIVRPVILTNGPKTNAYRAVLDPRHWTCGFISRADVADFLVKSARRVIEALKTASRIVEPVTRSFGCGFRSKSPMIPE